MKPRKPFKQEEFYEEYAYVLDFMPHGNPFDRHQAHRVKPVAQVIGDRFFTLLEVHPKPGIHLEIGERVYIGRGVRDKVAHIFGRIDFDDLTTIAQGNLAQCVRKIIEENEKVFVNFFNIAQAITIKLHALELLPGVGKKHLMLILEERKRKPFTGFNDLKTRAKMADPVGMLAERVIEELKGEQKYYLFIKPRPSAAGVYLNYLGLLYGGAKPE